MPRPRIIPRPLDFKLSHKFFSAYLDPPSLIASGNVLNGTVDPVAQNNNFTNSFGELDSVQPFSCEKGSR